MAGGLDLAHLHIWLGPQNNTGRIMIHYDLYLLEPSQLIASSSKAFTDGEFVKMSLNVVVEEVCPAKEDVFNANQQTQ